MPESLRSKTSVHGEGKMGNNDELIGKAMAEAARAGINFTDSRFLPMDLEKQQELFKQRDLKPEEVKAYLSACCYFSAGMCLETLGGLYAESHEIEDEFRKCVDSGALDGGSASVKSYEKIAKVFGVAIKSYQTAALDTDGKNLMTALLNRGTPLIIFLGVPGKLNHVEAACGWVKSGGQLYVRLCDPGYQNDEWLRVSDLATGKFSGGKFVGSVLHDGKQRYAYKIGYYSI